ncbi:glycosyltransferase [Turicibacter sanguinis]|nr:glycosyltransferase [Turicibacter sanguinis]
MILTNKLVNINIGGELLKVDILLATYNGEKYINYQIESILNQKFSDFRLIISDDCSTDNTVSIIEKYLKIDERIVLYKQKKNLGYIKNFEYLLSKSDAEYIMFCDQDDVWVSEKIQKQLDYICNKDCSLVYSNVILVDEKDNELNKDYYEELRINPLSKKCKKNILFRNPIIGNTVIINKQLKDKLISIPDSIPHDWYLGIIASLEGGVEYYPERLVRYRQHSNNTSGVKSNIEESKVNILKKNNILLKRNQLITERIDFLATLENHFKMNNVYVEEQKFIKKCIQYLENIKKKDKINFNLVGFIRYGYYMDTKLTHKIIFLVIFHFPLVLQWIVSAYNLIYKRAVK